MKPVQWKQQPDLLNDKTCKACRKKYGNHWKLRLNATKFFCYRDGTQYSPGYVERQ